MIARKVYECYLSGDHLTDAQIEQGIKHFQQLNDLSVEAGPAFSLAAREACRVANYLLDIQAARRR